MFIGSVLQMQTAADLQQKEESVLNSNTALLCWIQILHVFTMSIECFINATECAFSRNKGNSALIVTGRISVF